MTLTIKVSNMKGMWKKTNTMQGVHCKVKYDAWEGVKKYREYDAWKIFRTTWRVHLWLEQP